MDIYTSKDKCGSCGCHEYYYAPIVGARCYNCKKVWTGRAGKIIPYDAKLNDFVMNAVNKIDLEFNSEASRSYYNEQIHKTIMELINSKCVFLHHLKSPEMREVLKDSNKAIDFSRWYKKLIKYINAA